MFWFIGKLVLGLATPSHETPPPKPPQHIERGYITVCQWDKNNTVYSCDKVKISKKDNKQ